MKIITKKKQQEIDEVIVAKIHYAIIVTLRDTEYVKKGGKDYIEELASNIYYADAVT